MRRLLFRYLALVAVMLPLCATSQSQTATPTATEPAATSAPSASTNWDELSGHFNYFAGGSLTIREMDVEMRDKILVIEIVYTGDKDDHVPAYIVMPHGSGPFPAIIWGHWIQPGSKLSNRDEFLEEAVVLAHSGVMSLLIDAPMARPGYKAESMDEDPWHAAAQFSDAERQQIVDLRRGVDVLLTRRYIDKTRIAYVGHSFGAHAGAILAAVEKRISAFVLMAGTYSDEEDVRGAQDKSSGAYKWREQLGPHKVDMYFEDYAWDDPAHFLSHTDGKSIFLQYGNKDFITHEQANKYLDAFAAKDKKMEFYDSGHALNAAARLDRDRWLQQKLRFKGIDEKALGEIRQLR
jgi:dienelactone hydrolase